MVAQSDEPDWPAGEPDWPAHQARAGELAGAVVSLRARAQLYSGEHEAEAAAWIKAARGSPPAVRESLLLLLIRQGAQEGGWSQDTAMRVRSLRKLRVPPSARVPAGEAEYALRSAAALPDAWQAADVLACAAAIAARADTPADPDLLAAAEQVRQSLPKREFVPAADREAILRDLGKLGPAPRRNAPLDLTIFAEGDGWSAVVLAELREPARSGRNGDAVASTARSVNLLLHHLRAAGPRPAKAWLATAAALLAAEPARQLIRLLLDAAATAPGTTAADRYGWGQANLAVSARNADLLRAAAWAASTVADDWVIGSLCALVRRAAASTEQTGYIESAKVPAACVTSLGLTASAQAIDALRELRADVTDAGLRRQIGAAIGAAARRAGLGRDDLDERLVGNAGLDRRGQRLVTAGTAEARVSLVPVSADTVSAGTGSAGIVSAGIVSAGIVSAGTVSAGTSVAVQWRGRRGWSGRAPADADAAARHAVRAAVREVGQVLAAERVRLERLLAAGRRWPVADWRVLYCEPPVTGALTRGLIWVFETGDGDRLTGVPAADGTLSTPDGTRVLPAAAMVSLWHPVLAEASDVLTWQEMRLAQPFEQASRAAYRPAEAEQGAVTCSSRFAGRLLRYQQAHDLLTECGWTAGYLGPYDEGPACLARRDFPSAGFTAFFEHEAAGAGRADLRVERCLTGSVTFRRARSRAKSPARLARVPDLVFSETMRDIDLLIGAAEVPAQVSGPI
jgi:hypothetical protein